MWSRGEGPVPRLGNPVVSPRGFVSGTGVITRADGSKVPFEFKSEDLVSEDTFNALKGQHPAAVVSPPEGEG